MEHFSDEQISAYFLGKMPTNEAESFEIEAATDVDLSDRVQLVERELIDDYLRAALSDEDADCFEKNYLTTGARRERLSASRALWLIAAEPAEQAGAASAAPGVSIWERIFGKSSSVRLAFACAALLVCGAVAFYILSLKVDKTDLAEVKEPSQTAKIQTPPIQNAENPAIQNPERDQDQKSENLNPKPALNNPTAPNREAMTAPNEAPKTQPEIKQKPAEQLRPTVTMIVKLLPGTLRDGDETEKSIELAPNVKNINLLLNPAGEPNKYKTYRATIKTPEGDEVFTAANLKALSVTVPTVKLENRTYIVFLEGQKDKGDYESISEYTFRVRR